MVKACLLLLVCFPIYADNFYFRPLISPYGDSSGTSYENAWHKDDSSNDKGAVNWEVMEKGDTLFVCGLHDNGYKDNRLKPTKAVIIDGACPNDPGTLFHTDAKIAITTDEDRIYQIPYRGHSQRQLIEDLKVRLSYDLSKPGSFKSVDKVLHYRPSSPGQHTLYTAGDGVSAIEINVPGVTVRNLTLANVITANGIIKINAPYTTIDNVELYWGSTKCIYGANASYSKILNSKIHDCANGIYFVDSKLTSSDYVEVRNNTIYDIDPEFHYGHLDAHGIAFQGGHYNVIKDNTLYNIGGSGFTFYTYPGQSQTNNLIENNTVKGVKTYDRSKLTRGGRNERAFEDNKHNTNTALIYNNRVIGNTFSSARECIRTKSVMSSKGIGWSFIRNVAYDCETSFAWSERPQGSPGFLLENNTFISQSKHLDQQDYDKNKDHSGILINNNRFFGGQIEYN